jgi:hypothetical protein
MFFLQPEEKPMTKIELISQAMMSLEETNRQIMHLSETIAKNANVLRECLAILVTESSVEYMEQNQTEKKPEEETVKIKDALGALFPGKPGIHVVELDPNNPELSVQIIQNILQNLGKGGNGYEA